MFDPYYPQYPDYIVNPPRIESFVKYFPPQLSSPQNNYWPAGFVSLESMIYNAKTYGLDVTDLIMQDKTRLISTTVKIYCRFIDYCLYYYS